MNKLSFFIIVFLFATSLNAYIDDDIDGVDDSEDLCLDTPFDEVVDDNGCSKSQKTLLSKDRFIVEIGSEITFNDISKNSSNISFYTAYIDKNWDISLSTSSYANSDFSNTKSGEIGDIYLTSGYMFKQDKLNTKFSLGTKISVSDNVGTGQSDYYSSIFLDYFLALKSDLFLYYSYTISGDSYIDYENYSTISIGGGYTLTDNWYSSLSYDFSESNIRSQEDYRAISWYNTYNFSKKYYLSFNYTTGLDDLSYDHTISLRLGVNFD